MQDNTETWKDIDGIPHLKISSAGNVFSKKFKRLLKPRLVGPKGGQYYAIGYQINGVVKNFRIHILVAKHFLGIPNGRYDVNHKDGNKLNNHYKNLEWVSHAVNMAHAKETGLFNNSGENHYRVKLSDADVDAIKILHSSGKTQTHIASLYKINQSVVSKIINKKTRNKCQS